MATVNLANNTWLTESQTYTINISTSNTCVDFDMGDDLTNEMCCAKACIKINASDYKTITLQYSSIFADGITALYFGVFDTMIAEYYYNTEYDNGISPSSLLGFGVTTIPRNGGGTITIDIPSDVTGTKYVGFLFYGNTYGFNDEYGYTARQKIDITSIDAVESGYTLTYDANGGSGAPSAVINVKSTIISSTVPTRDGYDFLGWSESSSETIYAAGDIISLSDNTTLHAVWQKKTYTVTYDANGGSGAPSSQTKTHGTALTLSSTKPKKASISAGSYTVTLDVNGGICSSTYLSANRTTSYYFSKWNTDASGTGDSYNSGGSYTKDAAVKLYAIYTSSTSTDAVTLPTPTRDGYDFMGWATSNTATSGTVGSYKPSKNVTLYAIWKPMGFVYIYDGAFSQYQVFINDGSGWNQYVPYIYTESGWEIYSG